MKFLTKASRHHYPLGPIRVLDEESSSKTKRNAEKAANALSFFEITLHRGRVALLQGCTVAGLHRGTTGLANEKLFCIFLFFLPKLLLPFSGSQSLITIKRI